MHLNDALLVCEFLLHILITERDPSDESMPLLFPHESHRPQFLVLLHLFLLLLCQSLLLLLVLEHLAEIEEFGIGSCDLPCAIIDGAWLAKLAIFWTLLLATLSIYLLIVVCLLLL